MIILPKKLKREISVAFITYFKLEITSAKKLLLKLKQDVITKVLNALNEIDKFNELIKNMRNTFTQIICKRKL